MKQYLHSLFLIMVTFWLAGTFLIDFMLVPAVFRVIENFFNAGELGIVIFSKFNLLELILASGLTALLAWTVSRQYPLKIPLLLSVIGWSIVMTYICYLTPKISYLTGLFQLADKRGEINIAGINDIQLTHQFYHRLYIFLDGVKIIILTVLLGHGIWSKKSWP